ncbi:MAG: DUF1015 domain-containing protein [Thermodesulfobacteriota bacterium]|nr:DUF1015 domain-containing protein [Thermodesulfobacteriota bacterium]
MAIIAPFKGLTYNLHMMQNLSNLVAPPYDVISDDEQKAYYEADPYNVIRLILGMKKTGDTDWDNTYTRAADYFRRWRSEGILVHANEPSMYVTSHTYDPGNGQPRRTRWGVIALLRIEDEESAVILPHERTFSAHRDDRLKLMRACGAQFSQIFGLYEDAENVIFEAIKKSIDSPPLTTFDFEDGSEHRMWILQDYDVFKKMADFLSGKSIFIADGHHRYETARNFRNIMRTRYGRRPLNRSYEYVMTYLSNMNDKGLTILPSHRLIKSVPDFQIEPFLERLEKWFTIASFSSSPDVTYECGLMKDRLEDAGLSNTAIGFYLHKAGQCYLLSLKQDARDEMGDDLHHSLKKLDVLALSRFILQKGLGFTRDELDNEEIFHYQSSMEKAVSQVYSGNFQMVFLLNPTKIDHVKEIAGNSLVMPRKSTYFFPKLLTGLVFNKIDPHEIL